MSESGSSDADPKLALGAMPTQQCGLPSCPDPKLLWIIRTVIQIPATPSASCRLGSPQGISRSNLWFEGAHAPQALSDRSRC